MYHLGLFSFEKIAVSYPIINIVGSLLISGNPILRHSAMVAVRIYSSFDVMSQAIHSFVCAPHEATICSANLVLRYGASIKSCD